MEDHSRMKLVADVVNEILWSVTANSGKTKCGGDKAVSIFGATDRREMYNLKGCASQSLVGDFSLEDYLQGPACKHLCHFLNHVKSAKCVVQVADRQYQLYADHNKVLSTHRAVPLAQSTGSDEYFQFHIKAGDDGNSEDLELCLKHHLRRFKLVHSGVSLSVVLDSADTSTRREFQMLPTNKIATIGGVNIAVGPEHYLSKKEIQRSKAASIQIGKRIYVTSVEHPHITIDCQIGSLLFQYNEEHRSSHWDSSIKMYLHGDGGVPMVIDETLRAALLPKLIVILALGRLGLDVAPDTSQQTPETIPPDITCKVSFMEAPTNSMREQRALTPFTLVLHFIWRPCSAQEQTCQDDFGDFLLENLPDYLEENMVALTQNVSELLRPALWRITPKSAKQKQKEVNLSKAVPTVVDAIKTILCNSTNEIFRRNCLAYAGASTTQEMSEFLTDNLTLMTEGKFHRGPPASCLDNSLPEEDLPSVSSTGMECQSPVRGTTEKNTSFPEEDLPSVSSTTMECQTSVCDTTEENLEELSDSDLLHAFSQSTCSNSLTESQDILGCEPELSQATEEIVKSLLEEEDLFEAELLSSDWLTEE